MLENYSEVIEKLLELFVTTEATNLNVPCDTVRLVIKTQNSALVALVYQDGTFKRKVEIKEILELMNQ